MAGCLLDLSIHPGVLGGSLRFCEQPATRLKARSSSDKTFMLKVLLWMRVVLLRLRPSVSGDYLRIAHDYRSLSPVASSFFRCRVRACFGMVALIPRMFFSRCSVLILVALVVLPANIICVKLGLGGFSSVWFHRSRLDFGHSQYGLTLVFVVYQYVATRRRFRLSVLAK
jgi:hypothetical protein